MNTATSDRLIDSTVKPTSRAPRSAASQRRHARLDVARDVLEHDDRVVDDEAGGDRQRHQRQVVEAVAEQVHDAERADQRHRHGHARDQRRAARCAGTANTTRITSTTAISSVRSTSRSEARIVGVRSHRRPSGRSRRGSTPAAAAAARWTRSTVSMMLAPGWRKMISSTAGLAVGEPGVAQVLDRVDDLGRRRRAAPPRRCGRRRSAAGTRRRVFAWSLASICQCRSPSSTIALRPVGVGRGDARRARPRGRCRTCSSASGLSSTRTAGSELPPTVTWPTPSTCESFCASIVEAASYICARRQRVGGQRQDHDRRVGRVDLAVGRVARQARSAAAPRAALIAACTSRAAPSMSRSRSNCSVIARRCRATLDEVISVTPAMRPSCALERRRHGRRHGLRARAGQRRRHRDGREVDLRQRRHRQQAKRERAGERDRRASAASSRPAAG